MSIVNRVITIVVVAFIGVVGIVVVDALPAIEGSLAPMKGPSKHDFAKPIVLALGGSVTLLAVYVARFRSG